MSRSRISQFAQPIRNLIRHEQFSSFLLLGVTVAALVLANSKWNSVYSAFLHHDFGVGPLSLSVHAWINDGLMALFFLLVGIEIKREIVFGELTSFKKASLPFWGAVGGMVVPAAVFMLFNHGLPTADGWAIPMATDIAFALAIFLFLGNRVPKALKVFLLALAIIDDLGAITVIAVFYTHSLAWLALGAAGLICLALFGLHHRRVQNPIPYLLLGTVLWFCVLQSGIHATIAGVLLGFLMPLEAAHKTERWLHVPIIYGVMPLFSLANTGIALSPSLLHSLQEPLSLGILFGLILGKPLGILLFIGLALKLNWTQLPTAIRFNHLIIAALLGGIGFTMSIFITTLAFDNPALQDQAKLAIVLASTGSALFGYLYGSLLKDKPNNPPPAV
ncbi:MAG: Na+/H+ antiporter NhaA [Candidatus Margulisiibacteriota bacterium]